MFNAPYIERINSVERQVRPLTIELLEMVADAWGIQKTIHTLHAQYFDYGWYIEGRGVSVVIAFNFDVANEGGIPMPTAWRIQIGKLSYAKPPFGAYNVVASFPMTDDVFVEAAYWINEHGPGYFS